MRFWDKWKNHFKAGLLLSMLVLVVCATVVYAAGGARAGSYNTLVIEHVWVDNNNELGYRPAQIETKVTELSYNGSEAPGDGPSFGTATLSGTTGTYEDQGPIEYSLDLYWIDTEGNPIEGKKTAHMETTAYYGKASFDFWRSMDNYNDEYTKEGFPVSKDISICKSYYTPVPYGEVDWDSLAEKGIVPNYEYTVNDHDNDFPYDDTIQLDFLQGQYNYTKEYYPEPDQTETKIYLVFKDHTNEEHAPVTIKLKYIYMHGLPHAYDYMTNQAKPVEEIVEGKFYEGQYLTEADLINYINNESPHRMYYPIVNVWVEYNKKIKERHFDFDAGKTVQYHHDTTWDTSFFNYKFRLNENDKLEHNGIEFISAAYYPQAQEPVDDPIGGTFVNTFSAELFPESEIHVTEDGNPVANIMEQSAKQQTETDTAPMARSSDRIKPRTTEVKDDGLTKVDITNNKWMLTRGIGSMPLQNTALTKYDTGGPGPYYPCGITGEYSVQEAINSQITDGGEYSYVTTLTAEADALAGTYYTNNYYIFKTGASGIYRFTYTHTLQKNDTPVPDTTYTVIYKDGTAGGKSFSSDPDKGDTGYSVHPSLSADNGTLTPPFKRWIDPNLPETDKGDPNIPRDWKDGSNQTWTFAGWKLTTRASEPNGVDGVQPTVVAADADNQRQIIYEAQWVKVNYVVQYKNGDTVLQSFPAEGGALSENDKTPKFTGTEPEGFENWELTSRPGSTKPQLSTDQAAQRPINKADAVKTPGEDGSTTYTITYTAKCGNDNPPETNYKYKVLRYEVASTKTDADFAAAALIDTSAEQTSTTAQVSVAESYKSLTGYTFLNGDSHNKLTGTCTDGVTLELKLYFTKDSTPPPIVTMYNLAINYLEAGTRKVLSDAINASLAEGAAYNYASPTISGYTLVDIAQAVVSGTMPASNVTVGVFYAPAHTLTINYVDRETGEAVAPVHTETLKEGDSYEQTSPVVEGYVLADVTQSTISGTMPAESVVVTVYYVRVPQTATYTIRHMYYRNNDVLEGDVTRRYTGTVGEIIRFTSDMREPSYDGRYYDYQGYLSSTDSFELTADDARGAGQGFTLVYSRSTGGGGYTPDPTPDPKPVTPDPEPEPEPEPVIPEPEPVTPEPEPEPVTPEPEPEPQPEPTPTLPDPNDPDSPDEITIEEDGVPKTYIKVWDPENEEYVYILDEDVPLADQTPKTGDDSRTALWAALAGVSLAGAAAFTFAEKKRKNR